MGRGCFWDSQRGHFFSDFHVPVSFFVIASGSFVRVKSNIKIAMRWQITQSCLL